MKKLPSFKLASVLVLASALCGNFADATPLPIDGQIDFGGIVVGNSGPNLISATSLAISSANVFFTTGTYSSNLIDPAGIPFLTAASFLSPITLNQATPFQLWSINVSGVIYSFEATSISYSTTGSVGSAQSLNLNGTGIASISGGIYGATDGTWSIAVTKTATQTTAVFGFGSDNFVVGQELGVPDAGATALLILLGLGGIAWGRRAQRKHMAV